MPIPLSTCLLFRALFVYVDVCGHQERNQDFWFGALISAQV